MGGFGAVGSIVTGVAAPVNDLSRGSTVDDVYDTVLITALRRKKLVFIF
ncbi:phosphate acyltransferase [Mycoplasmopsis cynos]